MAEAPHTGLPSLPHEREKSAVEDIVDDCLAGRNKFIMVVFPSYEQSRYTVKKCFDYVSSLPREIAVTVILHREGLKFDNGAVIRFVEYRSGRYLHGLSPDRILIMGEWAEFWYLCMASGATIEAIA